MGSFVYFPVFGIRFFFFFFEHSYLFIFNFILFFNFTILYWFCHISKWIRHRYTCVPHPSFDWIFVVIAFRLEGSHAGKPERESLQREKMLKPLNWSYAFQRLIYSWLISLILFYMSGVKIWDDILVLSFSASLSLLNHLLFLLLIYIFIFIMYPSDC